MANREEFEVEPFEPGIPAVVFRGTLGSTSALLARCDLVDLLDFEVFLKLKEMSDENDEDIALLVNRFLRIRLSLESNDSKPLGQGSTSK